MDLTGSEPCSGGWGRLPRGGATDCALYRGVRLTASFGLGLSADSCRALDATESQPTCALVLCSEDCGYAFFPRPRPENRGPPLKSPWQGVMRAWAPARNSCPVYVCVCVLGLASASPAAGGREGGGVGGVYRQGQSYRVAGMESHEGALGWSPSRGRWDGGSSPGAVEEAVSPA